MGMPLRYFGGIKVSRTRKEANSAVQSICKLPAVNPATSAAGERSLIICTASEDVVSIQDGDLAVLNGHKRRTDSVSIANITQDFVSSREDKGASPSVSSLGFSQ